MPQGVDPVITYGSLKGVLDYKSSKERTSCSNLFAAVARTQPPLHSFGPIYKGWGAKLVHVARAHSREVESFYRH